MSGSFSTHDRHAHASLKPLAVASLKRGVYEEAKNLASELPGWRVVSADDARLVIVCERAGGVLSGPSTVTITFDGPEGIPSTTVNVRSESTGGWMSRDRKNVLEFMRPFHRRVC
jgi:hypothetical protein